MAHETDAVFRLLNRAVGMPNGCLVWLGARKQGGYGRIHFQGQTRQAHRVSYELFHGPIPTGKVVDHVCGCPSCIAPGHLRAVTQRENSLAGLPSPPVRNAFKSHCQRGHALTGDNLAIRVRGKHVERRCRACEALRRVKRKVQP